MKNLILQSAAILLLCSCTDPFYCEEANGPIISETLELEKFTIVEFATSGNVFITQDSIQKIEVEGSENMLHHINSTVRNNKWKINFDKCFRNHKDFNVYISIPDLESIILSGSGNISSNTTLASSSLNLLLQGSGTIDLDVEAQNLETTIEGSGQIILTGTATNHDITIDGSGQVSSYALESTNCDITITGSGSCFVLVNEELDVNIPGSGSVYYQGQPTVQQTISGSGSVQNRN